ncbi:hypothetical protein ACIQFZ_05375 [Streptomyces sp. NPDC093064]|uniref:hypothetical protein n=1 Tax=Streptomyces sp. NPDC093064 TaxID=3366020 RepID=UPI003821BA79
MSGARTAPDRHPGPAQDTTPGIAQDTGQRAAADGEHGAMGDTAGEVVRWAVFSCVLVPVALLWYGTSFAGVTGTGLGLAAATGACRALLRRSERGAARLRAEERAPHRGRHHGRGPGPTGVVGTRAERHRSADRFLRTRT